MPEGELQDEHAAGFDQRISAVVTVCINKHFFGDGDDPSSSSLSLSAAAEAKLKQFNQWQAQTARNERKLAMQQMRQPITFAVHDGGKILCLHSSSTRPAAEGSPHHPVVGSSVMLQHELIGEGDLVDEPLLYGRSLRLPNNMSAAAAAPCDHHHHTSDDDTGAPSCDDQVAAQEYWCLTAAGNNAAMPALSPCFTTVGELIAVPFVDHNGTATFKPRQRGATPPVGGTTRQQLGGRVLSIHPLSNAAWCAVDTNTTVFVVEAVGPLAAQHEMRALVERVKAQLQQPTDRSIGLLHFQELCARPTTNGDDAVVPFTRGECYQLTLKKDLQGVFSTSSLESTLLTYLNDLRRDALQRLNVKDNIARKYLQASVTSVPAMANQKTPPPIADRSLLLQLRSTIAALRHCISTLHLEKRHETMVADIHGEAVDAFCGRIRDELERVCYELEPGHEATLVKRYPTTNHLLCGPELY
ncbi:Hypothetical protein, putative [Bodo saltans]|uniref:Uncharacterized protein n=1 Tax=Bodo saltans TaxID=75058 RepID=A0A0S4JTT9_BODSA|nr:Hypothetical protein, putative [Bodo saltans]|eukprot:CUG93802.1 Hypothetical protein, putative [Bodo saltans]